MLFELLKQLLEGLQTRREGGVRSEREKARLMKLADLDDIEAYLTTFERIMVTYKVHSFVHLILTGEAFSLQATLPGAQWTSTHTHTQTHNTVNQFVNQSE